MAALETLSLLVAIQKKSGDNVEYHNKFQRESWNTVETRVTVLTC